MVSGPVNISFGAMGHCDLTMILHYGCKFSLVSNNSVMAYRSEWMELLHCNVLSSQRDPSSDMCDCTIVDFCTRDVHTNISTCDFNSPIPIQLATNNLGYVLSPFTILRRKASKLFSSCQSCHEAV